MGEDGEENMRALNMWRFPKSWGYPQIIPEMDHYGLLHYKPSSYWGTPIYGTPPCAFSKNAAPVQDGQRTKCRTYGLKHQRCGFNHRAMT